LIAFTLLDASRSSGKAIEILRFMVLAFLAVIALRIGTKPGAEILSSLIIFASSRMYFSVTMRPKHPLVPGKIALVFLHGVRGTLADDKFQPLASGKLTTEQNFKSIRPDSATDENSSESE
jgi:hypothetical protein